MILAHSRTGDTVHLKAGRVVPESDAIIFLVSMPECVLGAYYTCGTRISAAEQKTYETIKNFPTCVALQPPGPRHKQDNLVPVLLSAILLAMISSLLADAHADEDPQKEMSHISAGGTIADSQGYTIETWKPWQISAGQVLTISITDPSLVSQDKINAIKDAILSEDKVDGSSGQAGSPDTYYKGWKGALESENDSMLYIPTKFLFVDSPTTADITIELTDMDSPDGYSGYTESAMEGDHILKTHTTIYRADKYSADRLGAIVRHEFGHALGIGHSTDPEDLMHYVISDDYPYISGCDVNAIHSLYEGKESSHIVCGKQ